MHADQIFDESDPYVTVHIAVEVSTLIIILFILCYLLASNPGNHFLVCVLQDNSVHRSPQLVASEPRVAPMDLEYAFFYT